MGKPDKIISHKEVAKLKETFHHCLMVFNDPMKGKVIGVDGISTLGGVNISKLVSKEVKDCIKILEDCKNAQ